MKNAFALLCLVAVLSACNNQPKPQSVTTDKPVGGELAFLLGYNNQMPSDVGFLTNHVVERRLANMMKDSFTVFVSKTHYDRPIMVDDTDKTIYAQFYADSDRTEPIARVVIDVKQDAIWADYMTGDTIIEFTDHPSLPKPGI